ncbi:MAG: hypothetical protein HZB66_01180 [Candidatus Aenigmarchaeota archaeon]|nr:hypothetical protein [Candidatus Aenigmarchaeota archaeon]
MISKPFTIDFDSVREVRDLENSWVHPGDLKPLGDYSKHCREREEQENPDDIRRIALEHGGMELYLQLHVLDNGLRYVTVHRKNDGAEEFADSEYGGLFSCGCGCYRDVPSLRSAKATENVDLGDGHVLKMVMIASTVLPDGKLQPMSYMECHTPGKEDTSLKYVGKTLNYTILPYIYFGLRYHPADAISVIDFDTRTPFGESEYRSGLFTTIKLTKKSGSDHCRELGEPDSDDARRMTFDGVATFYFRPDALGNDELTFYYDGYGELYNVHEASRELLGNVHARPEFLAITEDTRRGEVDHGPNKFLASAFLGQPETETSRLDIRRTLDNLLSQYTTGPKNPIEALCFES